jgi:hypothetical protein
MRSIRGLMEVIPRKLFGETEENHGKPHLG